MVFTGRLKRGNKAPNSEESRDGKKQNERNERYLHLSRPSSSRAMSRDQVSFGNCNRMKLCNRKFPSAVQLKIILCDDFQAAGEF